LLLFLIASFFLKKNKHEYKDRREKQKRMGGNKKEKEDKKRMGTWCNSLNSGPGPERVVIKYM